MKKLAYLVLMGKEYPMIEYKDGWVAVDKKGLYIIEKYGYSPLDVVIIAQSSNLNLEGVVKVEIEEVNLKQEVLKFINHWELYFSSPKVGQPPSLQILKDAVNKAAQSKGTFTEEQVLKAVDMARMLTTNKYGYDQYMFTVEQIIDSLLPRYEVETKEVEFGHVDDYSKPHGFEKQPITYQKDGWAYYKLKY